MTLRKQFIRTLAVILGVDEAFVTEAQLIGRIDTLEELFTEKAAELEQVKEMLTVLIMSNPHIRIVDEQYEHGAHDMSVSGSNDPSGRLLN